jgi:hypothetical protein
MRYVKDGTAHIGLARQEGELLLAAEPIVASIRALPVRAGH